MERAGTGGITAVTQVVGPAGAEQRIAASDGDVGRGVRCEEARVVRERVRCRRRCRPRERAGRGVVGSPKGC